ncbi:hypothetical protein SAMN04488535_1430 [Corynebacterium mycetoides]|uniref:Uncharacterized protein n=1 Tax=Corynebacterium mycetoides TaxID=38302 RepID=A0A1G9PFT2_9CORY|nr:hypothetical protein SAMN04488535_1430 [Corynebacterium mycetoides]
MLSSALDIAGDLINYVIWFFNGLISGDPLYNWGSSF